MTYINVTTAAFILKRDRSRIKVLCAQGRIKGAIKIGTQWAIPAPPVVLPPKRNTLRGATKRGPNC